MFGLGGSGAYRSPGKTDNSRKKAEFEMSTDLPRPDKARAVATISGPVGGRKWEVSKHSTSGSEEELVHDLKASIQVSKSVDQNSTYGIAR
jgi:hypothetical protein